MRTTTVPGLEGVRCGKLEQAEKYTSNSHLLWGSPRMAAILLTPQIDILSIYDDLQLFRTIKGLHNSIFIKIFHVCRFELPHSQKV